MKNIESNIGEIVMYQPDETIRLEVRVEDETVWLTEKETVRKIRTVQKEGKRETNVTATIYTHQLAQNMRQLQLDIQRHNQQYPPITVNYCQRNHDRFLIIDDVVYLFGASLKDAGKKLFAYIKLQETSAQELLNNIR